MNKDIKEIIGFLNKKVSELDILVVGDIMLDSYYHGSVTRISPEAPVPVNKVYNETINLGGAGNVAANLAFLGANVHVTGILGNDENKERVLALFSDIGAKSDGVFISDTRKTTAKLRIIGAGQQMLRLDFEEIAETNTEEETFVLKYIKSLIEKKLDGIIISDYAKGFCSPSLCQKIINLANESHIAVLVDPKGYNWDKYENADFITPNVKELGEAAGQSLVNDTEKVIDVARYNIEKYGVKSILATRSEKGMTFVTTDDAFTAPATAQEVFDVSGAGDTVAAVFLAAIAGGLSVFNAAFLANEAAGLVVARSGTYPIKFNELLSHMIEIEYKKGEKYRPLSFSEVTSLVSKWREKGETVVFTNGCFDILHTGHILYLQKAANLANHLIIGLNTDASVKRLKGETRPIVQEYDRAGILAALACVDAVVFFDEDTPINLIKAINPDVLVKGGDYTVDGVVGREFAKKVEIVDFEEGYSTTDIVNKIAGLAKEGKL